MLYSTSYTATIPGIMDEFGVASRSVATLGLTTYLLGLAAGSVVVAPLSEIWGRRWVYLVCMGAFVVLIAPAGVVGSLPGLVVLRFVGYVCFWLFALLLFLCLGGWLTGVGPSSAPS